jgi:hypothetical protein
MAVSIDPPTEPGEKGGKESALVQETKTGLSRSKEEEFLYLFVEP